MFGKKLRAMFGKTLRRPTEILSAPVIQFVGEQDGEPERELKSRFSAVFKDHPRIERAYLALVIYAGETKASVGLCIKSSSSEEQTLVETIGDEFAALFGTAEHLDILFIRDDQESELRLVCAPFFVNALTQQG
jgi:hypothetical protein